jgi:hypothetical protein
MNDQDYSLRSIRFVEMAFDTLIDAESHFVLMKGEQVIGTVSKDPLPSKTLSKLTSLSEPK